MIHGIEILKHFAFDQCVVKIANVEPLGAPGALEDALCRLSYYRREKTMRYRFERGKWLSAGAGLLLDNMLMERGLRERDMEYAAGEHGKPVFVGHPKLYFNLSHSGNLVACALGGKPLGVDVQTIVKLRRSLVNYTMSDVEIAQLDALSSVEEQELYFTQLWTLKESYAKATGRGLGHEFPSFEIDENGEVTPLTELMPQATFKLINMPDAVASVAILNANDDAVLG
jgi:4'-phosphopantetheinyl transferase